MSDDKDGPLNLPVASAADVIEFFKKRVTKNCPACDYNQWAITSPYELDSSVSLGIPGMNATNGKSVSVGLPMAVAQCKRCSFIRLHGLGDITNWVLQGKPEFSDNE